MLYRSKVKAYWLAFTLFLSVFLLKFDALELDNLVKIQQQLIADYKQGQGEKGTQFFLNLQNNVNRKFRHYTSDQPIYVHNDVIAEGNCCLENLLGNYFEVLFFSIQFLLSIW